MRIRLNPLLHDGAIFLGIFFMIFSLAGLMVDLPGQAGSRGSPGPQDALGDATLVATRVFPTSIPQPTPSLTPFQALLNRTRQPEATPAVGVTATGGTPAGTPAGDGRFLAPFIPPATQTLPTPALPPQAPERIVIPAIQVDAPVYPAAYALVEIQGQIFQQWEAPNEYAAGWQSPGVYLGQPGNTVLNGHHNIDGEVFGHLIDLSVGDIIEVDSGDHAFRYTISNKMILPERYEPVAQRLENARWLMPSSDERLTLVTCWPKQSNTHRLIIVARPDR